MIVLEVPLSKGREGVGKKLDRTVMLYKCAIAEGGLAMAMTGLGYLLYKGRSIKVCDT